VTSDERVKKDVHRIGMLYDDTPVYSFKYIGDSTPQIGVMAQDVEKTRPDAVIEIGGIKRVHLDKATERARYLGC
jgi:endosialidase-like protein